MNWCQMQGRQQKYKRLFIRTVSYLEICWCKCDVTDVSTCIQSSLTCCHEKYSRALRLIFGKNTWRSILWIRKSLHNHCVSCYFAFIKAMTLMIKSMSEILSVHAVRNNSKIAAESLASLVVSTSVRGLCAAHHLIASSSARSEFILALPSS